MLPKTPVKGCSMKACIVTGDTPVKLRHDKVTGRYWETADLW